MGHTTTTPSQKPVEEKVLPGTQEVQALLASNYAKYLREQADSIDKAVAENQPIPTVLTMDFRGYCRTILGRFM